MREKGCKKTSSENAKEGGFVEALKGSRSRKTTVRKRAMTKSERGERTGARGKRGGKRATKQQADCLSVKGKNTLSAKMEIKQIGRETEEN